MGSLLNEHLRKAKRYDQFLGRSVLNLAPLSPMARMAVEVERKLNSPLMQAALRTQRWIELAESYRKARTEELSEALEDRFAEPAPASVPLCVFLAVGLQPSEYEKLDANDQLAVLERCFTGEQSSEVPPPLSPAEATVAAACTSLCEQEPKSWFSLQQIADATEGEVEYQTVKNLSARLQQLKLLEKAPSGRGFRVPEPT